MTMPVLREINGELVLEDPDAFAVMMAVNKHNCRGIFDFNIDGIYYFIRRMKELNKTPQEAVIVLISVDDVHGKEIAEALMPNQNWQELRDQGRKPFARGLAGREFMQAALEAFDKQAADKLRKTEGLAVVVVEHRVAEIYEI